MQWAFHISIFPRAAADVSRAQTEGRETRESPPVFFYWNKLISLIHVRRDNSRLPAQC